MKDETFPLTPPGKSGQSHDEIAAEIADHLAATEAELSKHGMVADEAHEAARRKFGDVEKIKQTCYWIQNGETIMLRWTLVSLAAVLCILLGLSVLGNWRTQSQLADEMGKLSAELKAMAAAKQAPPPAPQPPEITGVIYAGSRDKPVAGAKVAIRRADGTVARRTQCDEKGTFRSGPLEPGDYCVTTPLQGPPQDLSGNVAQSEPILVHQGSGTSPFDLDAIYHSGAVKIIANRKLPELKIDGKYHIVSRIAVAVTSDRRQWALWTPVQDIPSEWPIYCRAVVPEPASRSAVTYSNDVELPLEQDNTCSVRGTKELTRYPVGNAKFAIALVMTVVPLDENGDVVVFGDRVQSSVNLMASIPPGERAKLRPGRNGFVALPWAKIQDNWQEYSEGTLWIEKLTKSKSYPRLRGGLSAKETISIREDQFTAVHVEIPEQAEFEIQKAVDEANAEEFQGLVNKGLFHRDLKITKTTYEPISK